MNVDEKYTNEGTRETQEYYVSVSNIVDTLSVRKEDGSITLVGHVCLDEGNTITRIDPVTRKEKTYTVYQAPGGGAYISPEFQQSLAGEGAQFGKSGRGADDLDARLNITLPKTQARERLAALQEKILLDSSLERSPIREFVEECEELGVSLTDSERNALTSTHISTMTALMSVEEDTAGNKARKARGIESVRTYIVHNLVLPESLLNRLMATGKLKILSPEEVARIKSQSTVHEPVVFNDEEGVCYVRNVALT